MKTTTQNMKAATIIFQNVFFSLSLYIALKYVFTASHGFSLNIAIHSRNEILSFIALSYIFAIYKQQSTL